MSYFDLVMTGGLVVDGTGSRPFRADVGVLGDRVAFVGEQRVHDAGSVLDASGLVVAPGFIDASSHAYFTLLEDPFDEARLTRGITSSVEGGETGPAPVRRYARRMARPVLDDLGVPLDWTEPAEYAEKLETSGIARNVVLTIPAGMLRASHIDAPMRSRFPAAEFHRLLADLDRMIAQGAAGLSISPFSEMDREFRPEELVLLARMVARHDALLSIELPEDCPLTAIDGAIDLARRSKARTDVVHRFTRSRASAAAAKIDAARASGVDIVARTSTEVGASLEETVRLRTSSTAKRLRLGSRGRLARGKIADVVAFEPSGREVPAEMRHVLVNGTPVVVDGEPTGALPGRVVPLPSSEAGGPEPNRRESASFRY